MGCVGCASGRAWVVHGCRVRYTSCEGQWVRTVVYRCRCPGCWATTTLLPDCLLPKRQHSLDTIAQAIGRYLTSTASYRAVALSWSSTGLPAGETITTVWGTPAAPSPTPSTIWRWVERFARGALGWWLALVGLVQARLGHALVVPPAPPVLAAKARTPAKARRLGQGWHLLYLLGLLLALLGRTLDRWPQLLLHHPHPPQLDHSHWFIRAPPC